MSKQSEERQLLHRDTHELSLLMSKERKGSFFTETWASEAQLMSKARKRQLLYIDYHEQAKRWKAATSQRHSWALLAHEQRKERQLLHRDMSKRSAAHEQSKKKAATLHRWSWASKARKGSYFTETLMSFACSWAKQGKAASSQRHEQAKRSSWAKQEKGSYFT